MLTRKTKKIKVTFLAGESESNVIDFSRYSGGIIFIPAGWIAASIGFQVNYVPGGTYSPLKDTDGTLVEIAAAASEAFSIPTDTFGIMHMKLWSQSAGTGVNQTSEIDVILTVKS